jgi:hypothetical protein
MDRYYSFRRFNFLTLFFGLFMLVIMAGCVHVETTCAPGLSARGSPDGDGGCNSYPSTGSYLGSAHLFWDTASSPPYTQYQGTGNCVSGSKKCASLPGRCANGTACRPWVTPSTMVCKCDCNP